MLAGTGSLGFHIWAKILDFGNNHHWVMQGNAIWPLHIPMFINREPVPRIKLAPEIRAKEYELSGVGGKSPRMRVHSGSHSPFMAQQILVCPNFCLLFHGSRLPPLGNPKPLPATTSFVFSLRWYLRWIFQPLGELLSIPGPLPYIHAIKLSFDFLSFNFLLFICLLSI